MYAKGKTLTKNLDANVNIRTDARTDGRKDENYIPLDILRMPGV